MPLTLILNGQSRSFEELGSPAPLEALVVALGLKRDRVAIELNGEIVARVSWAEAVVRNGDKIEAVHFVGGGL